MPHPRASRSACLALCVALACLAGVRAAPAPRRPPEPPRSPRAAVFPMGAGQWVMKWGGTSEPMTLEADGDYSWGPSWRGKWKYDPATSRLEVNEHIGETDRVYYHWHVDLDARGGGTVTGGPGFTGVKVEVSFGAPLRPTD